MSDPAPPNPQNRTSLSVNTGGGPFVAGNVHTSGGNFVAGDQIAVTINNIVQGINDLPTRYDGVVRNFLEYYLGSTNQPAPFGGRNDALAMLDLWLADPHAPPYALLAAPAGRGKSALLAHWISRLAQRDDVHVIYFPISIRFNSNRDSVVFAALAARIAHVYGEKMTRANDAQEYRGVFVDYLRRTPPDGKPLLVVLDGLDEAAGWEVGADLFPMIPPSHLRVIACARTRAHDSEGRGWLTQLGWESHQAQRLDVAKLELAGVRDVLRKMGNPLDQLAPRFDMVAKLHELSQGDPLLVRLYVEMLLPLGVQAATFQLNDLLKLRPGLKAFFDRWFDEQKKLWSSTGLATIQRDQAVNSLLNLCALAHGPLRRDDILALAPNELPDTSTIEWAAVTLNRFLIGDGTLANGYVFGHPRLSYYFAERLSDKERRAWQRRFLGYGQDTLIALETSQIKPKEASPYAVRYYCSHMNDIQIPHNFYALVCEGWLRAWEWIEGSPDGFLSDVRHAWATAESEGAPALGQIIRAALCFSSLVSLSMKIDSDLLSACTQADLISSKLALSLARAKPEMNERFHCLVSLLPLLSALEQEPVLGELLTIARTINCDNKKRIGMLVAVAGHLSDEQRLSMFEEVLNEAHEISDEWEYAETLTLIIQHLSPYQHLQEPTKLLAIVSKISDIGWRAKALSALAERLPSKQQLPVYIEALENVRRIGAIGWRTEVLTTVVGHLPIEEIELNTKVLEETSKFVSEKWHIEVSTALSKRLPVKHLLPAKKQVSVLKEELAALRSIDDEWRRAEALAAVAKWLSLDERVLVLKKSLLILQSVNDEWDRSDGLVEITKYLPSDVLNLHVEMLIMSLCFGDTEHRERALRAVVERLPSKVLALLDEVIAAVFEIKDKEYSDKILTHISEYPLSSARNLLIENLTILLIYWGKKDNSELVETIVQSLSLEEIELFDEMLTEEIDERHANMDITKIRERKTGDSDLKGEMWEYLVELALEYDETIERADKLAILAKELSPNAIAWQQRFLSEACQLYHEYKSTEILSTLALYWEIMCGRDDNSLPELYRVIRIFSGTKRENLLGAIKALMPVIARLGGERAVRETAQAIIDTAKWWP